MRTQPCRSLSYTIQNVSRPNDKICLIASPIKQISYSLEKPVVINHSLTVTKWPLFSFSPVIKYPIRVANKWEKFYAFTSFQSTDSDELLSLKIKSVNFDVNIFTALYEGKRYPLLLSITDSIISSPNHAVNLTDLSGSENVSIHVKDSIIRNGRFILKNKRRICKPMEHVRNIVKISNVTIVNKGFTGLNVIGCFDVCINKLNCSNITSKMQGSFTFKGRSLKLKNILIENTLLDNSKTQWKTLFLIYSCAMDIQYVHIKNCKGSSRVSWGQAFTVFIVQKSLVKMRDAEVIGNSIGSFMFAESESCMSIQNSVFINNHFISVIFRISKKSTLEMDNSSFLRNTLFSLLKMESNSSAIFQNNTLTENNLAREVFNLREMSSIQLNDMTFTRNNVPLFLYLLLNSSAIIQNNTLTENNFILAVYFLGKTSTIQLNDMTFTRNNVTGWILLLILNCSAIFQNNALIENNITWVFHVYNMSTIQLNDMTFTRNIVKTDFLIMESNCGAIVKNNTLIGNKIIQGRLFYVYASNLKIYRMSLHNNTFMKYLIFAISSDNIILDLMRIKENRFMNGVIHIEDSSGRLANTYIENYDHFSVSAITVTCTYQSLKCFPFEFVNNTILWKNKLSVSIRPIIELTGTIIISNVNVLVASIPEIEVMRYSTKDVIRQVGGYTDIILGLNKVYSDFYNISSLFITCIRANVKDMPTFETFKCIPCVQDTFTLNNGSIKILSTILENKKHVFQNEITNCTCSDCPVGANCTEYIKSKSNFYGYKTRQQEVKFVPCPWNFCCGTNLCKRIDSCNKMRTGTLCGRCSKNNTESYLSTNCISVSSCQSFAMFWLIYCVYAFTLGTCLYYMKDLIVIIKTAFSKVSKVSRCFIKEKESEVETELVIEAVGAEEHLGKISHFTVSGIFALIVSFYQVKQVMYIDVEYKNSSGFSFITFISKFINLEVIAIKFSSYCPMNDLNAVSKVFIKTYFLTVVLIMASLVNYFVSLLYYSFGGKLGRTSWLKPSDRLGVCFIRVLMLNYKNMASVSLILLNCVEVAGIRVLHVKGDTNCFQWWQVIVAIFFFTWILFFPLSLKLSYSMFMKDEISFSKFIICLIIPLTFVVYKILNRNVVSVALQKPINESYVKRILKEMFEEPYRLKSDDSSGETIFYETWRLYQRVLLAIIATRFINPLERITFMTPVIILITVSYRVYRPYKPEMYVLHWMEIVSNMGFFVCLIHNMFRAFLYVYDINFVYPVTIVWEVFNYLDLLFSPIWVLICVFIVKPIYDKAKRVIKKRI